MRSLLFTLSCCWAVVGLAQTPETGGLRPSTNDAPLPRPVLSPEMRGDIYMARKMFREAVDVYREAPDSHILANKIGIAYHQMMALPQARRQYERAIKMKPDYSEAINNLGTVFTRSRAIARRFRSIARHCNRIRTRLRYTAIWGRPTLRARSMIRPLRRIRRRFRLIRKYLSTGARRGCCCRSAASPSGRSSTTI
jgi:tetratricopeptide (TPR) repeat protein